MGDDINKLKRQIENADLCIWLFSRHKGYIAVILTEEYTVKKEKFIEKLNEINKQSLEKK